MEIIDNSFLRQFETKVSGRLAIIEYSVQERKIFLTKIFVPEMKSKDEFSELFISEVLEIIRDRNISVVPTAAIITKFIRKNRKYKSLLPVELEYKYSLFFSFFLSKSSTLTKPSLSIFESFAYIILFERL